ncbi:MAG TPA: tetratricopeptide repeat protein [Stellaceae bacterium]|nr:tetratricopeptide repeat protein [Stellaceae bacterium]
MNDAGERRAHTFSTRAAARILAISPDRIRYWVKRSLVRPVKGGRQMRFGFDDLLVMRLAKELLPTRHHLDPVRRCLERVRGMFGPARPVTSLRLANHDGQIVVRDGSVMVEALSGQILLNFGDPPAPGKVEERFGPARVRERFEEARQLAESDPLRALTLYGELLGREPGNFEAHIDLAALLEREGDLAGALRALLGAAAIIPTNADVHTRLGLLYRRREDIQSALGSFLRATECDPLSLAAHRNLVELYELTGRKREALRHLGMVHRLTRV